MDRKKIILDCINELSMVTESEKIAFEKVLDYIAYKMNINTAVFSGKLDVINIIKKHIKVEELVGFNYHDFLGEIYKQIFKKKLPAVNEVEESTNNINFNDGNKCLKSVFIDSCGTGRVFLNIAKKNDNVLFYCTESDKLEYKIALINIVIYNVPARIRFMKSNEGTIDLNDFIAGVANSWLI